MAAGHQLLYVVVPFFFFLSCMHFLLKMKKKKIIPVSFHDWKASQSLLYTVFMKVFIIIPLAAHD